MRHFIPIVNRVEELLPWALAGSKALHEHTIIIDNRDTPEEYRVDLPRLVHYHAPGVYIHTPDVPLTTAQSMNLMLRIAGRQGHRFFTWQHLDARPLGDSASELVEYAHQITQEGRRWGVIFTHYDAFAAYNVDALNSIGGWDWKRFPYYYLDDDIHARLSRAGYDLIATDLPVEHLGSTTISRPERESINGPIFRASDTLYRLKHGHSPDIDKTPPHWWKALCNS